MVEPRNMVRVLTGKYAGTVFIAVDVTGDDEVVCRNIADETLENLHVEKASNLEVIE